MQKEKQLQQERENRIKNEGYRKIYKELEGKLEAVIITIEQEKNKREELEISHTKNEKRLLSIISEKEDEINILKNENANLRRLLEDKSPCTTCVDLLSEFNSLKVKNEALLLKLSKRDIIHSNPKITIKNPQGFSPEASGMYVPQSPSFDKSLDKSLDRHKLINNQLKFSRSESELLKLIDAPINSRSPGKTERSNDKKIPLLKLDCEIQDEYALPTFRNQENSFSMQKNLKNSLAEIKARIFALNSNRNELQNKMEQLESNLSKNTNSANYL